MNAVRLSAVGGAELGAAQLTCEAAAALALWVEYEVQPLALAAFGSPRRRPAGHGHLLLPQHHRQRKVGATCAASTRSPTPSTSAASSWRTGSEISVAGDWKGHDREARFLHAVHERACRYFRVAIGPDYNAGALEPLPPRPRHLHEVPVTAASAAALGGLHRVLQHLEEPRTVASGKARVVALAFAGLAQMGGEIAHGERHADARFRKGLARRADDLGAALQAA